MADGGSVNREIVLRVIRIALEDAQTTSIKIEEHYVTIVRDGVPSVYVLPAQVTRRMLQKFSNKFGVKIEWFYHPDMLVPGKPDNKH